MMQDGGQDGHLIDDIREMASDSKSLSTFIVEPRYEKTNNLVPEQARHKTSHTNTELKINKSMKFRI